MLQLQPRLLSCLPHSLRSNITLANIAVCSDAGGPGIGEQEGLGLRDWGVRAVVSFGVKRNDFGWFCTGHMALQQVLWRGWAAPYLLHGDLIICFRFLSW